MSILAISRFDIFKGDDAKVKFSLTPATHDQSGFQEWARAMRMVARLPDGVPTHFRRNVSSNVTSVDKTSILTWVYTIGTWVKFKRIKTVSILLLSVQTSGRLVPNHSGGKNFCYPKIKISTRILGFITYEQIWLRVCLSVIISLLQA